MGTKNSVSNKTGKADIPNFDTSGNLVCRKCLIYKPISEFYTDLNNNSRDNKGTECKSCQALRKKFYYLNKDKKEDLDKILKDLLKGCKNRTEGKTKKGSYKGKAMELDLQFLFDLYYKQEGLCAISDLQMTFIVGAGKQPLNISIDRIDNSIGYEKSNVQLVCSHINIMRGNLEIDYLTFLCKHIYEKNKK